MKNIKFSKNHKNGRKVRKFYTNGLASEKCGAPKGIRIPVASLKGSCPRPLDDGGKTAKDKRVLLPAQLSQES